MPDTVPQAGLLQVCHRLQYPGLLRLLPPEELPPEQDREVFIAQVLDSVWETGLLAEVQGTCPLRQRVPRSEVFVELSQPEGVQEAGVPPDVREAFGMRAKL